MLILFGFLSPFFVYTKSSIILFSSLSTDFGMPCALVRYWVYPPSTEFAALQRPWMVGFSFSHRLRAALIFSMVGFHISSSLMLCPKKAPRIQTGSPSLEIWISSGMVSVWLSPILWVECILSLCSAQPRGIITVFSILNFAPEALHHIVSISWS